MAWRETTDGIEISVEPHFLEDRSDPERELYVWSYRVRITNHRSRCIQLTHRRWRVTDSRGGVQKVDGIGVVGETPVIQSGDCYEYVSGVPLPTPSGLMGGAYVFAVEDGATLEAKIPTVSLDSPHDRRTLN